MKIRNGFVSNSSSSSFVVISKEPLDVIKPAGKDAPDGGYIRVTTAGASYGKYNISICKALEDKLRHFVALYAIYYQRSKDYFLKLDLLKHKIWSLGEKYGYRIVVECPPLSGYIPWFKLPWHNRPPLSGNVSQQEPPEAVTFVNIENECDYLEEVVKIIENEDTTELESYLFNPHSFCVLGGYEYPKTLRLTHKMRKFVDKEGYEYRKFGDIIEDHEVGDLIPGTKALRYTDAYHWGEYTFEDRIKEWRVNLYLPWRKIKDHKRIAMLKKAGAYEN